MIFLHFIPGSGPNSFVEKPQKAMRTRLDLGYYAGMKLTQKQTKTKKTTKYYNI